MQEYLTFRKMITPVIIQILFWIGAVLSIISGLIMLVGGILNLDQGGAALAFMGLIYMVLGPVLVRIYCEIIILFFRMNESLTDIKSILAARP